jgi:hypothetical protein
MLDTSLGVRKKRVPARVTKPYRVIGRGRDGQPRSESCRDARAFKTRLLAIAAENEVVSFDELVDLLDAS